MWILLTASVEVKVGGTLYSYMFFWQNVLNDTSSYSDNHYYVHADISVDARFEDNVRLYTMMGLWGTFGMHPITGDGIEGFRDLHLLTGWIEVDRFMGSPIGVSIGKHRILYGGNGLVAFDGGEDGAWGVKVFHRGEKVEGEAFAYRVVEGGGTGFIGAGDPAGIEPDMNLYGLSVKYRPSFGQVELLAMAREYGGNLPVWLFAGLNGKGVKSLDYQMGFAYLTGRMAPDTLVSAYAFEAIFSYSFGNSRAGFGAVGFSGGEATSSGGRVTIKTYENALQGPYTYGFYKWWVGFGPAHLLRTPYGFALVGSGSIMQNSLNMDLYLSRRFSTEYGPVDIRLDFWKYNRFYVPSGSNDMGYEIAFLITHDYRGVFTYGFTVGYWKPGAYFSNTPDQIGGYFFFYKSF